MSRLRWVRCNGNCNSKNECRFAEINLINLDDVGLFKTFGLCKKGHMVRASKLERILARY